MTEPGDLNEPALRDRAVRAARGDAPFDRLIAGGAVADVAMGEVRAADIGLVGPLIASVHPPGSHEDADEHLDASGLIASPGLIDTHMHVESSMVTPAVYAASVLPRGVTTVVWDPHEFGNVAGIEGMNYALSTAAGSALRILPLAPSCVPSAPGYETSGADFGPDAVADLLARPEISGLAEVMDMAGVIDRGDLDRTDRMPAIVQVGLEAGKLVCGHARGMSGAALQAYAAAGIASDHEITSAGDLLEKLRAGLTIELRGSHPHLLLEFATALQALPVLPPTLTLCTDDVFPDDLLEHGGLDAVLRTLVAHGLDPMRALRAATLNAAIRLGRADLGLIAPGRRADIVLFEDLEEFRARQVLRDGRNGHADEPSAVPDALMKSGGAPVDAAAFETAATGPRVRVATIDRPRFTRWGEQIFPVRNGRIAPPDDVTRIAVVHRHGRADPEPRNGFLTGWGTWRGAFATTVSHDSHNLTVFGRDTGDMAAAANAVIGAGGGMAVAQDGTVTALLELPVAGLVSEAPLEQVAAEFSAVRGAMDRVVAWSPPYLVFKALVGATLACNRGPHQTDLGIADPLSGRLMQSPILEDGLDG